MMAAYSDSPSIVFTADAHFDETGAWKYRGITGDAQHSFTQVVDFCCKHRANVLALGGDILDKPRSLAEPAKFLSRQLARLHEADVQVVYILGQHDGRQDWPGIHPGPIHLHGQAIDVDDFTIYGLDYMLPDQFMKSYAAPPIQPGAFLLCHQTISEFMQGASKVVLSLAQLPYAMNLLIGDFHEPESRHYTALDGSTGVAFSPGSTHARDVSEDGPKQFYAFYKGDLTPYAYRSIPLDTRPVQRYQLLSPDAAEKFLARVDDLPLDGEGLKRAVIDVTFYDDIDGLGTKLARELEGRCHLFLKPKSRRRDERAPSADARRAVADRGLSGAVALVCEPGPVRDCSERLLDAGDPAAELAAMTTEFYETRTAEPKEVA